MAALPWMAKPPSAKGIDKAANLVVIELKRTEDGGHMELPEAVQQKIMQNNIGGAIPHWLGRFRPHRSKWAFSTSPDCLEIDTSNSGGPLSDGTWYGFLPGCRNNTSMTAAA
jgi:hypothetical protein